MERVQRCWAMRVDHYESSALLWKELRAGRLRQGWGYSPDLDLRKLEERVSDGVALEDDALECWRGNRRMLETGDDSIQRGDLIVVPHLPEYGVWSLVRVVGDYAFTMVDGTDDYRHLLPIEHLSSTRPIEPNGDASAPLRRTMKARQRLWNLDGFRAELLDIASGLREPKRPKKAPLAAVLDEVRKATWAALEKNFEGGSFEAPCVRLLEAIYDEVEHTGGPKERGADAICIHRGPLGVEQRVVVQIKMWDGEASWPRPVEQIRQASDAYEFVTGGLILTTATSVSAEFERERRAVEKARRIPIRMILRDELVELFVQHLPDIAGG